MKSWIYAAAPGAAAPPQAKSALAAPARDVTAEVDARAGRTTGLRVFVPAVDNRRPMTTVVFADRDGSAFGPLAERIVPALLPLQGVPLLERMLRRSSPPGVGRAPRRRPAGRRDREAVRQGDPLGHRPRVRPARRGRDAGRRPPPARAPPRRRDARPARRRRRARRGRGVPPRGGGDARADRRGDVGGRPAGLWRLLPGAIKKNELPREPASPEWTLDKDHVPLPLATGPSSSTPSRRTGARTAARRPPAFAARARSRRGAKLLATVGEEALVLAGATLAETSVLPSTVIPPGVALANAVVSGNLVVDAATAGRVSCRTSSPRPRGRTGAAARWASRRSLCPCRSGPSRSSGARRERGARDAARDAERERPGGGRAPFTTFRFETAIPVLRDLPLLLAVVRGSLALTGVTPLPPAEEAALTEPWEKVAARGARRPALARPSRRSRRRRRPR